MTTLIGIAFGVFLAYANGSNDNFKGVATLYGSGTTSYRRALSWATITTFAGSLAALVLAQGLLATFSGKGLVPAALVAGRSFPLAVAFAAASTVWLATRFGFPVSTTHALTGAMVGAGLTGATVDFSKLGSAFLAPLLVSPALAIAFAVVLYPLLRLARVRAGIGKETCVCVGTEVIGAVPAGATREEALAAVAIQAPTIAISTEAVCMERYQGRLLGVSAGSIADGIHFLSAGGVSFARGLNDTPKIAAILLAAGALAPGSAFTAAAVAIAVGGLLNSRKIADTMSNKVTAMNAGQGLTANLVTGGLVIFASKLGLPVSTTHVSCGALFGIGSVTRQAHWKMILQILMAWVTTLPVAALLGAAFYAAVSHWLAAV